MQRIPEPEELMDDEAQALAYAQADFSEANSLFVDLFTTLTGDRPARRLLDLGCGPADIPLLMLRRFPQLEIDALDGAAAMLDIARRNIASIPQAADRISLRQEFLPCATLQRQHFDAVVSNSLLHHLADPTVLWRTIATAAQPGASVLVMDLARPASAAAVDSLVDTYASDAAEVLQRDFRNSLFAAYQVEEVARQLEQSGLDTLRVAMVSDRHLAVSGYLH